MKGFARLVSVILGVLSGVSAGGCSSGDPLVVSGKVIRGDISFIVVVDASDKRLKGEGIPGAELEINVAPDRAGGLLGKATSDDQGNLTVSIKDNSVMLRPAEFTATKEGFTRTSALMAIPPVNKRVLVILKPGAGPSRGGG